MTAIVVDASVALAWGFPDEGSDYAHAILAALANKRMLVPATWALEITNAIAVAERGKRIGSAEIARFVELLENLIIDIDEDPIFLVKNVDNVLPLAREYNLSAYDAAYLATAMKHKVPLATLDTALKKAAGKAGVENYKT